MGRAKGKFGSVFNRMFWRSIVKIWKGLEVSENYKVVGLRKWTKYCRRVTE